MAVKKSELYSLLWEACNKLRGGVEPARYKDYVLVYHNSGLEQKDIQGKVTLSKEEVRRFEVRKNDVFFTRTSETPDEVGLSAVLLEDIPDCVFSGLVLRGRPKNDWFIGKYCKYCFSTKYIREEIVRNCTYTTRALTNGKVLSANKIPVPPKPEQEGIADILSSFEQYIADLAELIEKKRGIREGALEDLMSGRTRIKGFTEEWGLYHLSDMLVPYNGLSGKSGKDFGRGEAKYITYLSVFNLPIVENAEGLVQVEEKEKQNLVKQGDILFTLSSETLEEVGMASGYMGREDVYLNSFCFGARPKVDLNSIFIAFYLRSHSMREKIIQQGQGSTRYNISPSRLFQIQVNIPNLTEQQAIADTLTAMDEEIEALEIEREKMIQIREGAMDNLLTGRVRLKGTAV